MAVLNKFRVCPINCAAAAIPVLDVIQDCIDAASFYSSQITTVWFLSKKSAAGATNPLPAAMTPAAFAAVIDNTDTLGTKMKFLSVEGTMPKPTAKTKNFRSKPVVYSRTFQLDLKTYIMNANNWNLIQAIQCGGFDGYIWFGTKDFIYGGFSLTDGATRIIEANQLQADHDWETGDDGIQAGVLTVTFDSLTVPNRTVRFLP